MGRGHNILWKSKDGFRYTDELINYDVRYVLRNGERVLQQLWEKRSLERTGYGDEIFYDVVSSEYFWKDVPLCVEENAESTNDFISAVDLGMDGC